MASFAQSGHPAWPKYRLGTCVEAAVRSKCDKRAIFVYIPLIGMYFLGISKLVSRVARFFSEKHTKMGKSIPNDHKMA
jgi:hypothetical protein